MRVAELPANPSGSGCEKRGKFEKKGGEEEEEDTASFAMQTASLALAPGLLFSLEELWPVLKSKLDCWDGLRANQVLLFATNAFIS